MPTDEPLANPVWHSLRTCHAHLAERRGAGWRYWASVAPFCAVAKAGEAFSYDDLREDGPSDFVSVLPEIVGDGFAVKRAAIDQMVYEGPEIACEKGDERELSMAEGAAMVELTDLAFPGYWRPETPLMGRYLGVFREGELVAMAGERMRMPGFIEISGVCTRPGFTGQGHASRLIRRLIAERYEATPFLHVNAENTRAISLYEGLGFRRSRQFEVMRLTAN